MSQIKKRLKTAYECIEFYANDTWVQNSFAYQRANQELYIRENKIRDAFLEEPSRPRTVQDSIPQSRLAQYSNYEYNESRELCYASSASNISFYYPCMFKRDCEKEIWMIPEVEQHFIRYSYAPDFNILEVLRREESNYVDEHEKLQIDRNPSCCWHDFHEIYPAFYRTLERTPGKPRYTSCPIVTEEDINNFLPSHLKARTFEDMLLRMRIISDNVRYLWCADSQPKSNTFIQYKKRDALKSTIGNYLLLNDSGLFTKNNLITNDFKQLESLTEAITSLEALVRNTPSNQDIETPLYTINIYNNYENEPEEIASKPTETPPTRRLYSAVLQGLTTTTEKRPQSSTDVTSPSSNSMKEIFSVSVPSTSPTKTESSSVISLTSANKSTSATQIDQTLPLRWSTQETDIWKSLKTDQESKSHLIDTKFSNSQKSESTIDCPLKVNVMACHSPQTCPNNASSNFSCSPANLSNASLNYPIAGAYLGTNNLYASNNACFNNMCGSNNYVNNSYQYASNFQNNFYINSSYQLNQVPMSLNSRSSPPQFNRQSYPTNQVPSHSMWFMQHSRPPTIYSFAHIATQPYFLPPSTSSPSLLPRQNQRWTPQNYGRPQSTLYSYHMPTVPSHLSTASSQQHWGMQNQNVYKANSSQHFFESLSNQSSRKTKEKPKKGLTFLQNKTRCKSPDRSSLDESEISTVTHSKRSSSSSEMVFPLSDKTFPAKSAASTSSIEFKKLKEKYFNETSESTIEKRYSEILMRNRNENPSFGSSDLDEFHMVPVATLSEVLERQALEQYQASDDNFYQELERQAEEQYEDQSENWISPPNKEILFGGLMSTLPDITRNYVFIIFLVYLNVNIPTHFLFLFS